MLVLTRKVNEKIRIGSDICITIVRVQGRSVRIGIEAPADVPILRAELRPHEAPSRSEENEPEEENPVVEPPARGALHSLVQRRRHRGRPDQAEPAFDPPEPRCSRTDRGSRFSPPLAVCGSSAAPRA